MNSSRIPRSIANTPPSLRLFDLRETMCARSQHFSQGEAIETTGWPKPCVHRVLGRLETSGLLARESDGRRYTPPPRLLRLAESTLSASTQHGVRHGVLRQLAADIGESCNLTALSGAEVIYLDRAESAFPLCMELRPGTRVPIHCSASGKLFLAHLSSARRAAILDGLPLTRHTATTLADRAALEAELEQILRQGYSTDAEEFVDGLVCVAVLVIAGGRRQVRSAVALQAPVPRMPLARALQLVPRLGEAAQALGRTWA